MNRKHRLLSLCVLLMTGLMSGTAVADTYPSRAIKLIIPFPPGGTTDLIGRAFADEMGKVLGQSVIVENRGGASGSIGAEAIARAAPDGYTIGLSSASGFAIHPACNPKVTYDPVKDFAPITRLASSPHVVLVNPQVPAKNYHELLALIKANPGKFEFATSGTCGSGHMLGEQMRPIVLASAQRVDTLPDTPTFGDVGINEANEAGWYGLVAPAGTPPSIIATLHSAALKALENPVLVERLHGAGASPGGTKPEEHGEEIKRTLTRMQALVKARNIQPN